MPSPSDASVSGQRPTTAREAANAFISSAVVWVAWITPPALIERGILEQPFHRPTAERATHSSTSRICSAAWIWIGPSGVAWHTARSVAGRHRAQRVRRDADASLRQRRHRCTRLLHQIEEAFGIVDEAALPAGRRRAAKSAIGVERRQQRQPDPVCALAAAIRSAISASLA
jgi:hypothetical protein